MRGVPAMGDDTQLSRWMGAYLKTWHYMSALPGEVALQGLWALAVRAEVSGSGRVR